MPETVVKSGDDQGAGDGSKNTETGTPGTENQGDKDAGKTFTQEKVNEIVSRRINEVTKKYAVAEQSHKVLQNMMADPEFRQWLDDKSSGKRTTTKATVNAESLLAELTKKDPELAPVIKDLITIMVEERVGPVVKTASRAEATASKADFKAEVRGMEDDTNTYPWMLEQEFKKDMADVLQDERTFNIRDAYDIAAADRSRRGETPPKPKDQTTSQTKKDATLLESEETGGTSTTKGSQGTGQPKLFKSVEECFASVADERGWYK
jgi:hypothetical protein